MNSPINILYSSSLLLLSWTIVGVCMQALIFSCWDAAWICYETINNYLDTGADPRGGGGGGAIRAKAPPPFF